MDERDPPPDLVIYSDGYNHPFAESSAALAAIAHRSSLNVRITQSLGEAMAAARDNRAILAVNALRWSMTQFERYDADRPEWAGALADADLAAMSAYVSGGGALLAMHTAVICWDNQPGWKRLLGGGWTWHQSYHPPLGEIDVSLTPLGTATSTGPEHFRLVDEAYHHLDPEADCEIFAHADSGDGPQPVIWRRRLGEGRIVVDALGHDGRSLSAPGHEALLAALIEWLAER